MRNNDAIKKIYECERRFESLKPFWHLFTDGTNQEIIFKQGEDFRFAITSIALALHEVNSSGLKVRIYAFTIMSNHVHELVSGSKEDCYEYFRIRRGKLMRYFGAKTSLTNFKCTLKPINDIKYLREIVAYIHRNAFVVDRSQTPYSYEWSSGRYYFNPAAKEIQLKAYSKLSFKDKRDIFRSRVDTMYNKFSIFNGYVSPLSFCEIEDGETLFHDAHKYFHMLSRDVESYSSIANELCDTVFLNDEELYLIVYKMAKEKYMANSPKYLTPDAKLQIAKEIHYQYNASNSQIQRILKLDRNIVATLFPKANSRE